MSAIIRSLPGRSGVCSFRATFSTSAISHSRRQVLVQLTADVDGLGFTNDRVLVSPGRARNQLIPARQAAFVPWKRPSDKEPRLTERTDRPSPSNQPRHFVPSPQLVAALASLPASFTFPHATTSATSKSIHGSVTLTDVVKRLEDEFGIPGSDVQVGWIGREDSERIKELDVWEADVRPRGAANGVKIGVEVTRAV